MQESEELLRLFVEHSPAAIAMFDTSMRYLLVSDRWLDDYGLTDRAIVGKSHYEVFPEIPQRWIDIHQRCLAGGSEKCDRDPFPRADGRTDWVRWEIRPWRRADGNIGGIIIFSEVITEIVSAEESLRRAEELLNKAQRVAHVGSWVWNIASDRLEWSDEMYRVFGLERDTFSGLLSEVLTQSIHPDDRAAVEQSNRSVAEDGRPVPLEYRVIWPDGSIHYVWAEAGELVRDEAGKPALLSGIVKDITGQKRAEASLQAAYRRANGIIEASPVPIALNDEAGAITFLNRSFKEIIGYTLDDIPTVADWWPRAYPDPTYRARVTETWGTNMAEARKNGTPFTPMEVDIQCKSGEVRTFLCSAAPLEDQSDHMVILYDITDRKRAADESLKFHNQLQQAQKMESLGSLAGGVAHDMNNVLGAILGLASASLMSQPAAGPTREALKTIIKATERGGKMVKQLLSFARQSPAEECLVDMNAIIREEASLLERTTLAKVRLHLDLAANLRPIRGDASALNHAVMNLCVNALDAMPDNGTLTLRTRTVDQDWTEVVVEDTGIGMSQAVLDKALDPFFTTKEPGKGTGLGLSMVYSTVKAHGGQLSLQSEPGCGTTVLMRFPACGDTEQAANPGVVSEQLGAPGLLKVMLVDDDELIQTSMTMILEAMGHSVVTAPSGEEALARLETGFTPDLVILDMNMPGLGGAGTLPRLRALRPALPVLLSTGRTDQMALDLAKAHPFVTLQPKPSSASNLRQALERLRPG